MLHQVLQWHHMATSAGYPATTMGFGILNLVEGIVDHHLLGLHHVNETVPREQWIYWDVGFLAWGALMLVVGWVLKRSGRARTAAGASAHV